MERLTYDLHIHSCLSPCGDNDSTPCNILNMALLNGLDVIALTDHNTSLNCPAIIEARDRMGLSVLVLPGMELCTAEEIHVVCLFDTLDKAMRFSEYVYTKTMDIKNSPENFGQQLIYDSFDEKRGEMERLLITAADISVTDIPKLMREYDGAAFPAHIDKDSYSILASLGEIPPECGFATAEIKNTEKTDALLAAHPILKDMNIITDSDAHYLWDISEGERTIDLPYCTEQAVIAFLRGEK